MLTHDSLYTDEDRWIQWPLLPVVRRGTRETGMLISGQGSVVFEGSIWNMPDLSTAKQWRYEDYEKLEAEWRID
jgi:hypothetical protein